MYPLPFEPPSPPPSHPSISSQSARLGSLCYTATFHQLSILHRTVCMYVDATFSIHPTVLYSNFSLAVYFTQDSVYVCWCYFLHSSPPFPSPTMSTSPFTTSASLFLPCKLVHQYNFSRFHMSNWLKFVLSWLSDIPLYICATSSLSIHLSMDI